MKKMTKWKRVLTLGLVLAMAVGQPATAMAAEPSGEDFALAEDGAVDPGLELLRQAADAPQTADDEAFETVAEEAEPVAWQAAMENLQAKLNNGEQPTDEEVYTALSSVSGSDLKAISDSDYEVKRYRSVSGNDASLGYISITNKATGNKEEDYLYAALITPTAEQARTTTPVIVLASRIKPGDTTNLYKAWTAEYERVSLDNAKSYTLVLGREEGGYEMGVVGWYSDSENPSTMKAVSDVQVDRLITAAEAVDPGAAIYEDGYTGIEMKAVVQKNQNVKITWKKKDASGTQYKGFKLYGIKEDGTEFDKVVLNSNVTAASCIIKAADVKKAPMVYLLECYTDRSASGEPAKRYVTVAAPYLLSVQNGYSQGNFDFSFGRNVDTDYHNYRLDMALKNAVYNPAKKDNNGFRDEWSQFCEPTNYFYNDNEWTITAKNKMRFATATYTNEKLNLQAGKAVFARVRSTYQLGGLMVTSAPSNVINVKYGPEKCDTLCIAGVKYNAQNASKNIERATSHIKYWMSGEGYDQENYVHSHGTDADAKSGMVFFVGKNDSSQIKGYDLLRSDSPYGNYKKVKFYALNNK
nr:hypothetical protein [Lachnospiraceae bacterium]